MSKMSLRTVGSDDSMLPEMSYGSYVGPDSDFVKLVSCDGHEFFIRRKYALVSNTIKAMLFRAEECDVTTENEVYLREVPSHILQKVCKYMFYKLHFTDSSVEIPEFPIEPEISMELLMTASFLDC